MYKMTFIVIVTVPCFKYFISIKTKVRQWRRRYVSFMMKGKATYIYEIRHKRRKIVENMTIRGWKVMRNEILIACLTQSKGTQKFI